MSRKAVATIIWASILLLSSVRPAYADTAPGEGFDVLSYELELTPDIANKTIVGIGVIALRVTDEQVHRLSFTGNALSIDSASVDGDAVSHQRRGDVLDFDLPKPLARGRTVKLQLSFHGRPKRGFAGSGTSLYTSYFACDWMICAQNQFGDKADFALNLIVTKGMQTLSVGQQIRTRSGSNGREVHMWKAPRPYSAYLFGFAVGKFAKAEQQLGQSKLSFLSDVASPVELERRFAETDHMVRFLADKAGVPLPVAEYSQLLVEGDEAQEAATYSVLGVNELPKQADNPAEDWAIMHELTHQWWGNLITCATLKDFWLNEGITTFMTAAWKEHRYGRTAYDAELDVARTRLAKARDAGFDKPLTWDGPYPSLGTRRAVQYGKGALFMDHLRKVLGEEAFWSGLRRYTRTHAGGTVTSSDLQKAMEATSGKDLRPLFEEWVY
jgi:aminopeptidase N